MGEFFLSDSGPKSEAGSSTAPWPGAAGAAEAAEPGSETDDSGDPGRVLAPGPRPVACAACHDVAHMAAATVLVAGTSIIFALAAVLLE